MHIQLTDFGSSVILDNNQCKCPRNVNELILDWFLYSAPSLSDSSKTSDGERKSLKRTNSFVGTAQFVAPEILKRGAIHLGFGRRFFLTSI